MAQPYHTSKQRIKPDEDRHLPWHPNAGWTAWPLEPVDVPRAEEAFGVVERPWFEFRLRAHFHGTMSDDKAFYALRNVIWAYGCRIMLSKTASFHEASQASWALFENALSVHTEILFVRASMVAVQALILMVRMFFG